MGNAPQYVATGVLVSGLLLAQGCASQSGSLTGEERVGQVETIDEPAIKDIPPKDIPPKDVRAAVSRTSPAMRAELTARNATGLPQGSLRDVLFDFDHATLRIDALPVLEANARRLQASGVGRVLLEGRGDEFGTAAYNIVLGDRRARSVQSYLRQLGLVVDLRTTSYGKDRPLCFQHTSDCWQKNRSVHFVVKE